MQHKTFTLQGSNGKPIFADVIFEATQKPKALLLFCHGYKGFKDWGAWHLIAKAFAEAGFFFVKFNFSHNGTQSENPTEFTDLEAFGMDNYSKQMTDLNAVIDYFEAENEFSNEIDFSQLSLIGHSRGGGIAILQAKEDARVKELITWAGVSDFGNRFLRGRKLEQWKKDGIYYIVNGRTQQKMPHYIQFYEDFLTNQKRFHIKTAVKQLNIPFLIVHGTHDDTVDVQEAEVLFDASNTSKIKWIANANHVFGMSHPWSDSFLPIAATTLVRESIDFLNENISNE